MKTCGGWLSRNPTLAKALAVTTAVVLVGVWVPGLLRDDLAVPLWRSGGRYYHFHGVAAWLLFVGFVCVGASVLFAIARRRRTGPGNKTELLAVVTSLTGALMIVTMMVLKMTGLV